MPPAAASPRKASGQSTTRRIAAIQRDALTHQADDKTAFTQLNEALSEVKGAIGDIKDGQQDLAAEVGRLRGDVAKLSPIVDDLAADKIRTLERAKVLKEVAVDKADGKKSVREWVAPLLAVVLAFALGVWGAEHFGQHPEARVTTTTTLEKTR